MRPPPAFVKAARVVGSARVCAHGPRCRPSLTTTRQPSPRFIYTSPVWRQQGEKDDPPPRAKDNDVAPPKDKSPTVEDPLNDTTEPELPTSASIDDVISSLPPGLPEDLLTQLRADLEATAASEATGLADTDKELEISGLDQDPEISSIVNQEEERIYVPRPKKGFFNMGEESENPEEDDELEPDDISTPAHFELEQERELREFARVIVWDMPLLYNHRKPFKPAAVGEKPLRWRYTTYMGEHHPAAKKVVLSFKPEELPLTAAQALKFKKLVGPRYNPEKGIVTMSAEYHSTPAQNKRHLLVQLQTLLKETKEGRDTLEDIPLDTRHYKKKRLPKFPEEWKMTEKRAAQLAEMRAQRAQLEGASVPDGKQIITDVLSSGKAQMEQPVPVRANAQSARGGRTLKS